MAVSLEKSPQKVTITKSGSEREGLTLPVSRFTPSGAVVVESESGFRTYQRGQYQIGRAHV